MMCIQQAALWKQLTVPPSLRQANQLPTPLHSFSLMESSNSHLNVTISSACLTAFLGRLVRYLVLLASVHRRT